jgi:hypothetical protein
MLTMNSKHRKTLITVFFDPVSRNLEWRRIESLLLAAREFLKKLEVTP